MTMIYLYSYVIWLSHTIEKHTKQMIVNPPWNFCDDVCKILPQFMFGNPYNITPMKPICKTCECYKMVNIWLVNNMIHEYVQTSESDWIVCLKKATKIQQVL